MLIPYSKRPKTQVKPVGNDETGLLYFKSINARTAAERMELDELDLIKTKAQLLLLELAKKIAEDKQISLDEALEMILNESTSSQAMLDYKPEIQKIFDLREESECFKDIAVTVMFRERIAYSLIISEDAPKGSTQLTLSEPLSYPVPIKSILKADNGAKVYVQTQGNPGDEVLYVEQTFEKITEGTRFFLLDDKNDIAFGLPDFDSVPVEISTFLGRLEYVNSNVDLANAISELGIIGEYSKILYETYQTISYEDKELAAKKIIYRFRTRNLKDIPTPLIEEIFNFYQLESSGGSKETKKEA